MEVFIYMTERVRKSNIRHIGLDVSITSTGFCVIDSSFNILNLGNVTSKPGLHDTMRFNTIWDELSDKVAFDHETDTVMIEAYAMQSRRGNILVRLAELTGMIKSRLVRDCKFHVNQTLKCSPSTLKKYALGSGKAEKSMILKTIYKKWNVDIDQDDIGDAYVLSRIGCEVVKYAQNSAYTCSVKYEHECIQSVLEQNDINDMKRKFNG